MKNRELKKIPGFSHYAITKDGKVWSYITNKWLKPCIATGYLMVNLKKADKLVSKFIHRLVLETYVGPCPPGMECRHLDGDSFNSSLDNLRWGTHSKNIIDSVKHKTHYMSNQHNRKSLHTYIPNNLSGVGVIEDSQPELRLCLGCGRDCYDDDFCPACSKEGHTQIEEERGRIPSRYDWGDCE